MKAVPDQVLDAPPPQLEALPAFTLPQPLPPPHSTLARAGNGASSAGAALALDGRANGVHSSGQQSTEQQQEQAGSLGTSRGLAGVQDASAAPRRAERAGLLAASASGGEATAEAKRLRLDSDTAAHAPLADMAEGQTWMAQDSSQQADRSLGLAQALQQAQEQGRSAEHAQCLAQQPERAEKQRSFLEQTGVLVTS